MTLGSDRDNGKRRESLKCYECGGIGHIRVDCHEAQQRELKCSECRGVGHTRRECPNSKKGKGVPLQSSDDSESEEDGKVMKNMVAFGARREKSSESSDSDVSTDSENYQVMHNKWLNLKNENLRLQHDLIQSREQYEDLADELVVVNYNYDSLEKEVSKLREVAINEREREMRLERDLAENRKQIRMLNSGSKSGIKYSQWVNQPRRIEDWDIEEFGAKGACQEVHQDVRQGVRQEVLQRVAVSNKPKIVHQCNNMKVRQEVLKHGCAAGTRKETYRCISNCVRPSKKQYQMCCCFCGKVGHKKVECFAREKSRNMAKKVNKTFTKPKRVEEVSLAKSGLLDEIKDETSEDGCSSGRSDLEVDQEASSVESGHGVVCDTKGKEIKKALGADGEGLMFKKKTHDGSLVLNRSWSKGSSTGASDRDAVLVIPLQQGLQRKNGDVLVQRMHISWGRKAWCGAHLMGEKSTFGMKVSRDRDTEADLIEREKLLEVFWVVLEQWLKYLTEKRHKRVA
ncbi:hypothetical protein IGI04_019108 [Brassica rapa subsp. trilocularis]|uniref:CCHC-type domain-containing protein n=1 Tax=Brassica rapa subsp. trilocularis TaxID=1813537 RepID=A0ABQ7MEW8_BRACM|nr:hypothetical protein IGI04_019108 [Brassica rapa subsp. trilocularis]